MLVISKPEIYTKFTMLSNDNYWAINLNSILNIILFKKFHLLSQRQNLDNHQNLMNCLIAKVRLSTEVNTISVAEIENIITE